MIHRAAINTKKLSPGNPPTIDEELEQFACFQPFVSSSSKQQAFLIIYCSLYAETGLPYVIFLPMRGFATVITAGA